MKRKSEQANSTDTDRNETHVKPQLSAFDELVYLLMYLL